MSEQDNAQHVDGHQGAPPPPPPPPPPGPAAPGPVQPTQQQTPPPEQPGYPPAPSAADQHTAVLPAQQQNTWQQGSDAAQTTAMPAAVPQRESVLPGAPAHQQQYDEQRHDQHRHDQQQYDQQERIEEPARRRSVLAPILIAVLALVLGLGGGYAVRMFTADATASDEYQEQQELLTKAEEERTAALAEKDEAEERATTAEGAAERAEERAGEVEDSTSALQEELDERSNSLDELEEQLDERQQELDERAADLEDLEAAVTEDE